MNVSEIMTPAPECTRPDATVQEAAARMKELNIGSLPVCDADRLVGMITDRDIAVRSASEGHDPRRHSVREAMSPRLFHCFDDQDVSEAAKLMKEKRIRRLPVLDRDRRLVGIVSLGDLAVETHDEHLVGSALGTISSPSIPRR